LPLCHGGHRCVTEWNIPVRSADAARQDGFRAAPGDGIVVEIRIVAGGQRRPGDIMEPGFESAWLLQKTVEKAIPS